MELKYFLSFVLSQTLLQAMIEIPNVMEILTIRKLPYMKLLCLIVI